MHQLFADTICTPEFMCVSNSENRCNDRSIAAVYLQLNKKLFMHVCIIYIFRKNLKSK